MKRWFKTIARYTMIGVADVNGFIDVACATYLRQDISDEGTTGMVTKEVFEEWVEEHLCPVLGNYSNGEARSVVMLVNALAQMSQKVVDLIEGRSATILFTAPFHRILIQLKNFSVLIKDI